MEANFPYAYLFGGSGHDRVGEMYSTEDEDRTEALGDIFPSTRN